MKDIKICPSLETIKSIYGKTLGIKEWNRAGIGTSNDIAAKLRAEKPQAMAAIGEAPGSLNVTIVY